MKILPFEAAISSLLFVTPFLAAIGASATATESTLAPPMRVVESTGAIEADVAAFRLLLGNPLNGGLAGQQPSGRREINWDGVPVQFLNNAKFPFDFFNVNSTRGLLYEHTVRALEVSSQSFIDVDPSYAAQFTAFSNDKLFTPRGDNESDVRFTVAGSNTAAGVHGFGIVFSDVDIDGGSGFEAFGADGLSLGVFRVHARSDARGASFVGVAFRDPVIARVHIFCGSGALAPGELDISAGGLHDLVVMDDFLYGEPVALP
jgi:hypothetical protein